MSRKPKYWQIGAGSYGRYYGEECIRFGMAFVGGDENVETIREVDPGDRVILKYGTTEIVAVGTVVKREGIWRGENDKDWTRDFDGWDLRAWCYVDWHKPKVPIATMGLTRSTIQRVRKQHLINEAEEIIRTTPQALELEPEPPQTSKVEDEDILKFLIAQGLRPGAAEELTSAFRRIRGLASYYREKCCWEDVREHETRTFLVTPLLLALGWAEQQIKIELPVKGRKRADLALFSKPYTEEDSACVMVIETKGFDKGLTFAQDQVKAYAKKFPRCHVVVATNGFCYKAFMRKKDGSFPGKPTAYLNLLKTRDGYPLDPKVPGTRELLKLLLPSNCIQLSFRR